jgi:hypothetical protein
MWHFWGTEDIANKKWEVKAFKQGMEEKINPITFKDENLAPRGEKINGHARSTVHIHPEHRDLMHSSSIFP